jgi:hypothetical protein
MRRRHGVLVTVAAAWSALLVAGCGAGESAAPQSGRESGEWKPLSAAPLSPREGALGLWTGREVLLIGGSDARPCPPSASCVAPDVPPLADGAAFDPQTGRWRRIADAPVPFEWAEGVVIGATAYLRIPGSRGRPHADSAFLGYRIDENRWEKLAPPSEGDRGYAILAAGDRVVAHTGSDEAGEHPDLVFDPHTNTWSELPPDPLSPSFDRSMAWSGRELILFDHELVPNPGSEKPALTRAAALDLETGSWRRLPDSEMLASGPWASAGGRLINPTLGGSDGGEVGNWGRTYPYGGILDPMSGEWSRLPNPPEGESAFGSGVVSEAGGQYFGYRGWLLEAATGTWIEIAPLDTTALVTGRTVVAAGADLLVFGGARWKSDGWNATLLKDGWIWSPRAQP